MKDDDITRRRNSSRTRRSSSRTRRSSSRTRSSEDEFASTKTPCSSPFSYYDEYDDDEDEEDEENLLEIIIETLTGTTFQVRVSPWETAAGLKNLLHRTQGIPSSDQHILLGQTELLDDSPLIDQGVQDGSNLKLVLAMKGGPINVGRNASDDSLWREFSDYMDVNRDELWDGNQGKPVTLLVLREGENVNLYRVVENQDGTFSPLNESWGSNASISGKTDISVDSRYEDEIRHRKQMKELSSQMESIKLRKKERKKQLAGAQKVTSPRVRVPTTSKVRKVRYNISPRKPSKELLEKDQSRKKLSKRNSTQELLITKSSSLDQNLIQSTPLAKHLKSSSVKQKTTPRPTMIKQINNSKNIDAPDLSTRVSLPNSRNITHRLADQDLSPQMPLVKPLKISSNVHNSNASPRIVTMKSLDGSTPRLNGSRGSRPGTQETSYDLRRQSTSRGSRLEEIPRSQPPKHVDFSTYKRLDSIKGQQRKLSLGTLSEDANNAAQNGIPRSIDATQYDAYRKSLVKYGKKNSSMDVEEEARNSWSGREVPLPLYMDAAKPKKNKNRNNRLYQSHNFGTLHPPKDLDDRPKTSPEILERRINSAATNSNMSDRIHMRGPDDKLKELITILNTSRANSRLSNSPPFQYSKSTAASKSFPLLKNARSSARTSVSLASSRNSSFPSVPSTPGTNLFLASGSTECKNYLREIARSQGIGRTNSSKRSTPEKKKPAYRRPGSGHFTVISTPRGFMTVTPKKKKIRPRCNQCSKKIGVSTSYSCRCGKMFCSQHRYSETHECSYDYKAAGRKLIEINNPLVVPPKLPKI